MINSVKYTLIEMDCFLHYLDRKIRPVDANSISYKYDVFVYYTVDYSLFRRHTLNYLELTGKNSLKNFHLFSENLFRLGYVDYGTFGILIKKTLLKKFRLKSA